MDLDLLRQLVEYKVAIIEKAKKVAEETERIRDKTKENQCSLEADLLSALGCISKYAEQLCQGQYSNTEKFYFWSREGEDLVLCSDGSWELRGSNFHGYYRVSLEELGYYFERFLNQFINGIKELTKYTEYDLVVKERETAADKHEAVAAQREAIRRAISEAYEVLCKEQLPE